MQNKRYFFEISYNGNSFHGWQKQKNALGIQQVIEEAFSKIFHSKIAIVGSGRTDAGVHAKQQFFHCNIPSNIFNYFENKNKKNCPYQTLVFKLNCMLSKHIAVHHIYSTLQAKELHARFSAVQRQYQYHIHTIKNVFLNDTSVYLNRKIDIVAMNQACRFLIGKKNFKSFSQTHTQVEHYICDLTYAQWIKNQNNFYRFEIHANRFLRGMVRNIVGTIINIGTGDESPDAIVDILKAKDRRKAGHNFPPQGLILTRVKYPKGSLLKLR